MSSSFLPAVLNIINISKPNLGLNLFASKKLSFSVIHKDTCVRWSKFSPNSRYQNVMFTSWLKLKIIAPENKSAILTRSSVGSKLLSNALSFFLKTSRPSSNGMPGYSRTTSAVTRNAFSDISQKFFSLEKKPLVSLI